MMPLNRPVDHPLARDYLHRLETAAGNLPPERREELVAEIREHIDASLPAGGERMSEAHLRTVLDRLGTPAEIAAAAGADATPSPVAGPVPSQGIGMEILAVILLLVGGIVVPFLGWILGVVLLWYSSRWTVRDKLLGTLVLPGGLLLPSALGVLAARVSSCEPVTVMGPDAVVQEPATACGGAPGVMGAALLIALVAAPVAMAIWLLVRARRAAHGTVPPLPSSESGR